MALDFEFEAEAVAFQMRECRSSMMDYIYRLDPKTGAGLARILGKHEMHGD